jgi:hypothetical protein
VNQELQEKSNPALKPYEDRPVGRPPAPDLSAMTKEETEARRAMVGRLSELVKKAEKGNKKAVPELRDILRDHPDFAWRFMDLVDLTRVGGRTRVSDVNADERSAHDAGSDTKLPARVQTRSRSPCPLLAKQEHCPDRQGPWRLG